MARKKRSGRREKKIPVLATAGAAIFAMRVYDGYRGAGGSKAGVPGIAWTTIGMDNSGKIQGKKIVNNLAPLAIGIGGSMLASRMGANRYLKLPFIKL